MIVEVQKPKQQSTDVCTYMETESFELLSIERDREIE